MSDQPEGREVFFEYIRLEDNLRVCAIDSVTGIEIITVLPAKTTEHEAQKIALNKLLWRLNQENSADEKGNSPVSRPPGKYV